MDFEYIQYYVTQTNGQKIKLGLQMSSPREFYWGDAVISSGFRSDLYQQGLYNVLSLKFSSEENLLIDAGYSYDDEDSYKLDIKLYRKNINTGNETVLYEGSSSISYSKYTVTCLVIQRYSSAYPTYFQLVTYTSNNPFTNPTYDSLSSSTKYTFAYDPYFTMLTDSAGEWGPDSGVGGGTGTFDDSSDDIDQPETPSINITSTGLVKMWKMTPTQLISLGAFLWDWDFFDNVKKLFNNPMDYIISLEYVPFTTSNSQSTLTIGGIDTGVAGGLITNQYITFDFGNLEITEYWGGFLDYSPNTKIEIYLPYKGVITLDTDNVMGASINLRYMVDLYSGTANITISVVKDNLNSVLYSTSCEISNKLPLSATNYSQQTSSLISGVMSTSGVVAGATLSAPMSPLTSALAVSAISTVANSGVGAVMGSKPTVEKCVGIGGASGLMGVQNPYLIITRPIQSKPANYGDNVGFESNIYSYFGDLTGYTKIKSVHLDGIGCTDDELEMINNYLKSGVIF